MSELQTLIYAELLANIRQISVIVSLDTECDPSTTVDLSPQRDSIAIRHHGKTSTLPLPGRVAASALLQSPSLGNRDLSWRLPLAGEPTRGDPDSNESPWSASNLGNDTQLFCRFCDENIVKKGSIPTWKDLPSENWAEMMDFWHCHKPTEHESHAGHSHDDSATMNKGYGANSKFTAQSKVGFVDLTTFLLEPKDPHNVMVRKSSKVSSQVLECSSCSEYIGHVDENAQGYRLYKWRLKSALLLGSRVMETSDAPSTSSIITAQLQSIMLAQCCSKLIVIPMDWKASSNSETTPATNESSGFKFLHFWVLNPTIRYTTTPLIKQDCAEAGENLPVATKVAMKVFWKRVLESDANKLMDTEGVEEIVLPQETINEIKKDLVDSADLLPRSGRTFQDWNIGLLDRWDASVA